MPVGHHPSRESALQNLLAVQHDVIARGQLLALGFSEARLRTWLCRDWRTVHGGVYVAHSGPLTRPQLAWSACLALWPAALARVSALPDPGGELDHRALHVVVSSGGASSSLPGVDIHEKLDFHHGVLWQAGPPRQRPAVAILDQLWHVADQMVHVDLITKACRSGWVQPAEIRAEMNRRTRVTHRDFTWVLLADIEQGTHSVLEQAFQQRVLRAHGLPEGCRQVAAPNPDGPGTIRRDAVLEDFGLIFETDGWMHHRSGRQREADLRRDLDAAALGLVTIRIGWSQATRTPCTTAANVAQVLRDRGWAGTLTPCGPACRAAQQHARAL